MTAKTPIWLDCDPGHDDAFAIILAAEHPSFHLLGISSVHGNAPITKVLANTLSILTAIGRTDIPVYSGCHKPFMRPAVHAPAIHGETGIDGTTLLPLPSEGTVVQPGNAILAMYNAIMGTPAGTCVIAATGALTNIALCFATFPEVASHIKEVSIMGGAFGERPDSHGNITKNAEFNIYCDPESAQSIFSNPLLSGRITLAPLDLTHTALATPPVLTALIHPSGDCSEKPTNLRKMLHDLLTFFSKTYADVFNITAGPPLHDPLAVAAVLPTDEISWVVDKVQIHVSCDDNDEVGRTIKKPIRKINETRGEGLGKGGKLVETIVKVPKSVDVDAFWKVILASVEKVDGRYTWVE